VTSWLLAPVFYFSSLRVELNKLSKFLKNLIN
jgi:hypothetical protein